MSGGRHHRIAPNRWDAATKMEYALAREAQYPCLHLDHGLQGVHAFCTGRRRESFEVGVFRAEPASAHGLSSI